MTKRQNLNRNTTNVLTKLLKKNDSMVKLQYTNYINGNALLLEGGAN